MKTLQGYDIARPDPFHPPLRDPMPLTGWLVVIFNLFAHVNIWQRWNISAFTVAAALFCPLRCVMKPCTSCGS